MLRLLLLIGFISLSANLQAQPGKGCKCDSTQERKNYYNCIDATGRKQWLWKTFTISGLLKSEINYKDNKQHGLTVLYFTGTGKIREQSNYFDGRRDEDYINYYRNGQTKSQGSYNYGKKIGKWTYYHKAKGEISQAGNYVNDRKDGEWNYYSPKGILLRTITYKAGKKLIVK